MLRLNENNLEIVNQIIHIEQEAFGSGGLNEFTLVPIIRHGQVFTYNKNNQCVGAAEFIKDWEKSEKTYLIGIAIGKEYHNKGYGTKFLNGCLKILKNETIKIVELTVDPNNKYALNMYKKIGFIEKEFRKNEYGKNVDRLVMELDLVSF